MICSATRRASSGAVQVLQFAGASAPNCPDMVASVPAARSASSAPNCYASSHPPTPNATCTARTAQVFAVCLTASVSFGHVPPAQSRACAVLLAVNRLRRCFPVVMICVLLCWVSAASAQSGVINSLAITLSSTVQDSQTTATVTFIPSTSIARACANAGIRITLSGQQNTKPAQKEYCTMAWRGSNGDTAALGCSADVDGGILRIAGNAQHEVEFVIQGVALTVTFSQFINPSHYQTEVTSVEAATFCEGTVVDTCNTGTFPEITATSQTPDPSPSSSPDPSPSPSPDPSPSPAP